MTAHRTAPRRRVLPVELVCLVLLTPVLVLLAVARPVPAYAHSAVVSVVPAEGAAVAAVREVRVVFNEDVRPEVAALVVTGSDGQRHDRGRPEVTGPEVSVAVDAELPPGETTVAYRVVSADGHPVSGQYRFTVVGSAAAGSAGDLSTDSAGSDSAGSGTADPETARSEPAGAAGDDSSGTSPVPIVIALVTIPIMGVALFLLIRRGLLAHTRHDSSAHSAVPHEALPTSREPDE